MTEIKTFYNVNNLDLREINFLLGQIANRLDALEGHRGTPKFYSAVDMDGNKITNAGSATESGDVLTYDALNAINNLIDSSVFNIEDVVLSGLDADKPAPTGSGTFYWATDTLKLYFDAPT